MTTESEQVLTKVTHSLHLQQHSDLLARPCWRLLWRTLLSPYCAAIEDRGGADTTRHDAKRRAFTSRRSRAARRTDLPRLILSALRQSAEGDCCIAEFSPIHSDCYSIRQCNSLL
jgi:hypothetical protein